MTIIACVAIVCASALVGLRMHHAASRPQVARADLDVVLEEVHFLRGEVTTVERKLVEWGQKVTSIEKVAKLARPEPILRQRDAADGPMTRKERHAARGEKPTV